MDRIQLGVVHLPTSAGAGGLDPDLATSSTNPWCPLTTDLLTCLSYGSELSSTLIALLQDPGISFEAQCQVIEGDLVVRCSLLPSDAGGSNWRRKGKLDRSKLLKKLFYDLRSGWDGAGAGDWLLATTVGELYLSEISLLIRKQEEDRYGIHDLYAQIPSPPSPSAEDWMPLSLSDSDAQARLLSQGDLKGLKSSLYNYQIVSLRLSE